MTYQKEKMTKFASILSIRMKKYFIFVFLSGYCSLTIFSQIDSLQEKSHFEIKAYPATYEQNNVNEEGIAELSNIFSKLFSNTNIRILFGATQFFGDIKQFDYLPAYEKDIPFSEIRSALAVSFTKKLSQLFSIQSTAIIGSFGGLKRNEEGSDYTTYEPYPGFYEGSGEYFISSFKEIDLNLLLNLSNATSFFTTLSQNNYTFYLKAGIGLNTFNSLNRNLQSGNYIYSWGYQEGVFEQNEGFIKKNLSQSPKETVYIYGLIAEYELTNKLSLIIDLTKRKGNTDFWDLHNNNAKDDNFNFYSLGFSYDIGKKHKKKEWISPLEGLQNSLNKSQAQIEWMSLDNDHDGISNAFDKESNTPIGVSVDGSGSALDVDMDNIPDYLDADPFSSRGAIVDASGVEFDSDNDGVPDSKDLESNTVVGSIVNQYGIGFSENINSVYSGYLPSVYFEKGSYYINKSNLRRLATIAIMMNNNPNVKLKVIGNADKTGTIQFNQKLALKRADEVVKYLSINFGINQSRFTTQSNGETKPLSNIVNMSEGIEEINILYEINRRVDFEIIH